MSRVDVVVVGGGHNGLAAAAYLARAGRSVLLLERRDGLGGATVSERPFAGVDVRLSRDAYLVSLLPRVVVDELGLDVRLADRPVAAYAPVERAGRATGLLVETDAASAATRASFREVTGSDAGHDALLAWSALVAGAAQRLWPTVAGPLPTRAQAEALLGPEAWRALVAEPIGAALEARFADPVVRGMVATDALIGTFAALDDPSVIQNRCFLYHVIGGGDGRWRVPVGGMGGVAAALERAARDAGADLRTGAAVGHVDAGGGTVTWTDAAGEHAVTAGHVLVGCAPERVDGLGGVVAARAAAEGAQVKVNLVLDRLPRLRSGAAPEQAFAGTFRLHEDAAELEAAFAQAARGEIPDRPPAELYCHTLTDRSIVGPGEPEGRHTLTAFVLHAPTRLFTTGHDARKTLLVDRVLDGLDAHLAEPIRSCVARDADGRPCVEARTPQELEAELGLPGGHIFHGPLSWPWDDPADGGPGGPRGVATASPRVLLCGAAARRGGGVSALGGRDAAMPVLGR